MASRPLPPGRRGRGGRSTPALHLPDVKILSDAPENETATSSYVEQLRAERAPSAVVEPQHESTTKEEEVEPAPVRSVKAFVSTLEKAQDSVAPVRVAAAACEGAPPPARFAVSHRVVSPPPVSAPAPLVTPEPAPVVHASTKPVWQTHVAPKPEPQVTRAATPIRHAAQPPVGHAASPPVQSTVAAPVLQGPAPVAVAPVTAAPVLEGFHPFKLLLPVYSVPEIPETVDCVFDDAAVEMQKNIMKTVKKMFGKDRSKLEDFKINSRLYGNNFMDPAEYLDSLVKDLGGNRALLLVPCLVSIQPDFMKRSSMLVAARSYRLRNLARLEATLDKVQESTAMSAAAPAPTAVAMEEVKATVSVSVVKDAKAEQATFAPVSLVQETIPKPVVAEVTISQPPPAVLVAAEPAKHAVSEPLLFAAPEPQLFEAVLVEPTAPTEAVLAQMLILESSPASVSVPTETAPTVASPRKIEDDKKLDPTASFITVDTNVSSERSSLSSPTETTAEVTAVASPRPQPVRRKSTLTLFGEEIIGDDTDDEIKITATDTTTKPSSTTPSPKPSLFEAESLFGEVIPVSVKRVAEPPAVTAPSALKSPPRTGMLFGFASAGGGDSDSDSDSEFSD
jgi:hypothetical protein